MPRTQSTTRKIMEPRDPFIANYEGYDQTFNPGMFFDESHELVQRHPELFREARVKRSFVEQATAAPGELR